MEFPTSDLKNLAWDDADPEVYDFVTNITGYSGRWRETVELIFRVKETQKYYRTYWERGLTENCDHSYWYGDTEECEEVKPIEKVVTTIEYVKV